MRYARSLSASSLGLLLGLCGCYTHYGYSPYGTYPYGPAYPAGPGGGGMSPMPPSTPDVPYPGGPGTGPTPIAPGGSPAPIWQPGPNQPLPGDPNAQPTYEPESSGSSKGLVPKPQDDQPFGGGTPPGASLNPTKPAANLTGSGVQLQQIESGPAFPSGAAAPSTTVANGGDPFESPMRSVSSEATLTARAPALGNRPNPYAHDARNFSWLRGIAHFDQQDQRWMMIYSANPTETDRFGGSITLSDHDLLDRINPGDVILVEGSVDNASLDQHGKPLYRIDELKLLKPKS